MKTRSRIRVLLVSQQFATVRSGVGTYARGLALRLGDCGVDVTCLTSDPGSGGGVPNVRVVPLERPSFLDPTPGGFISLARRAAAWLSSADAARQAFDLVHFTDAREAFLLPEKLAFPAIGTVHDDYALAAPRRIASLRRVCGDPIRRALYYGFLRRVEPVAYGKLARLLVNSDHVMRSVALGYGVPRHRMTVVPIGVEKAPSPLEPEALDGAPPILFAGSNFYRKGLPTLLLAAAELRSRFPSIRVHVVGEDRNAKALLREARAKGVPEGLARFHGRKPPADVRRMMASALCTVLPSRTEALGLVLLESMTVGTPVIASRSGGSSELVVEGESGLLVPPGDPAALAAAIARVADDAPLRRALAARGLERSAEFTPERTAAATAAVYREALGIARADAEVPERV